MADLYPVIDGVMMGDMIGGGRTSGLEGTCFRELWQAASNPLGTVSERCVVWIGEGVELSK